jgi:hypothetical protein
VFVALGEAGRRYRYASHPDHNNGERHIGHDITRPKATCLKWYHAISEFRCTRIRVQQVAAVEALGKAAGSRVRDGKTMRRANKPKPSPTIEPHKRLWSAVQFHGAGLGTIGLYAKGLTLVGLYATKKEVDEAAAKVKGGFVLPPNSAWPGKCSSS